MLNLLRFNTRRDPILPYTTDLHSHILPGVDDGAPDLNTSMELIWRMSTWGIRRIIATPHVARHTFENTPDELDRALVGVIDEARRRNVDVELSRSAEYRIDDLLRRHLAEGTVTPFPCRFILVENSFTQEPASLDDFLYELKVGGYRPILAHPERYNYYWRYNRQKYGALYRSGTFLQINVLSLAGYYGREEKEAAEWLVGNGYVDFLGTDLHSHRQADAIEAYISTGRFEKIASKLTLLNDTSF